MAGLAADGFDVPPAAGLPALLGVVDGPGGVDACPGDGVSAWPWSLLEAR